MFFGLIASCVDDHANEIGAGAAESHANIALPPKLPLVDPGPPRPLESPKPYSWRWRDHLEQYLDAPLEVRRLLQRADKESSRCRGGAGAYRSTLRACNRRQALSIELRKLGWCWGGAHVGFAMRWLRCVEDPDFDAAHLRRTQDIYFSEELLNEAIEDEPKVVR